MEFNSVNWGCVVILALTFGAIAYDKALPKRIRYIFYAVLLACILLVFISPYAFINITLCGFLCFTYFYKVTGIYKKDRLTGLLLRHHLLLALKDYENISYDLVLIDVDNFKLINDKYGHDKGDEALVRITDTTLKYLPKGCKMYRYGGDEFVVVSRSVARDELKTALDNVNNELAEHYLRISCGIEGHKPGDSYSEVITKADKAMYENKRWLKSEDIWDDMTGLFNFRGFLDELDVFRKSVKKDGHMVCLLGVDVDRLSNINKAYGYNDGNLIIKVLANSLKNCLHGRDFIGHLGSDEFVAAIECTDEDDKCIDDFSSKLLELVSTAYELSEKEYSVKINIDKYFIENTDEFATENYINDLLYMKQEAKDNRRKNEIAEVDRDYSEEENATVMDILDNNKFQYAFQPVVSAKTGAIVAYESLMRSDTETMVSPLKILKYAERNKRCYDVEKLTLFNTLAKFSEAKNVPEDTQIFINCIAGHFLTDEDFARLKEKYGHLFKRMVIEISEQREMDENSIVALNTRCGENGIGLAIDDYGNGSSNTQSLLKYMPQIVKLDRVFITGIDRNPKKQFFISRIINFAKENSMLTIAEGVETEAELRTVVRLGIDMIQGYITGKPSVVIVNKISEKLTNIIVEENNRSRSNQPMVYTAGDNCELSLVQLSMDDYTKINVSAESVTIRGSSDYNADMLINIKDNVNCVLRLSDVNLTSVEDNPCIVLGKNTNVVIELEGENSLNKTGIFVPESSNITIKGSGVLKINVKGHECFAIGTDTQTAFGNIDVKSSGLIDIYVDGEECTGIGGGIATENSSISLLSGNVKMNFACVNAVGIGCHSGDGKITIVDTAINSIFRANAGTVIGSRSGRQDIELRNFDINCAGSGSEICVIGSHDEMTGKVVMNAGTFKGKFSGHSVSFIGGDSGDVEIDINHCSLSIHGEGDVITGFGTRNNEASITMSECAVDLTINASAPVGLGAKIKTIEYIGPAKMFNINGVSQEIYDYA